MNVTLVRPTTFINMNSHPLNIGYIYSALSAYSYLQVSFIDGEKIGWKYRKDMDAVNINQDHPMWNEISNMILETQPDVIAFSCYTVSMTATKYIVKRLRNSNFTGQIWAGGIHPTACAAETLKNITGLNGIVIGEGDITIKEVCKAIYNHEGLQGIKGIVYRDNESVRFNESRPLIEDLDELQVPSRTFSNSYTYKDHIIMSSRGCPFICDFCDSQSMWTRRVRYRSGEHVCKEIKSIADLGVKSIRFSDDTFALRKTHVESVCKSIKDNNLDRLRYTCGSRINTMDDEMISILKKINMDSVSFGVETGSPVVQKRIKKNLDISTIVPTVLKTNKAGFRTLTHFMIGHPGETKEEIEDSFSLIRDLSKHCRRNIISVNIVCPYPGTGYWNYATEKYGEFIDFYKDSYKYYHQSKPFVNISNMEDRVLYSYIDRIMRYANNANFRYKFLTAIENPSLLFLKIKEHLFFK